MTEQDGTIGCEYCRNQENCLIDGLADDPVRLTLLLECPLCGQYYGYCGVEPHWRPPLTFDEAAACFPDAFRSGRPDGYLRGCTDGTPPSTLIAMPPEWRSATAVGLAERMYDSRDFTAMPILADALEDAGCDHPDVLSHCRGDGPHVRGCWVVDLVLGKA